MSPYAADSWLAVPVIAGLVTAWVVVVVWGVVADHVAVWHDRRRPSQRRALDAMARITRSRQENR